MARILFLVIAGVGLTSALSTVLSRNLVRAAVSLAGFFFTVACLFILLEAEFLAALQVLIYVGAVSILLMFGIMLTRSVQGTDLVSGPSAARLPGIVVGLVVFAVLGYAIFEEKGLRTQYSWGALDERTAIARGSKEPGSPLRSAVNNMGKVVGVELMTRYVIAFELAGLLLTAALVGAVAVAHREEDETKSTGSGVPPEKPEPTADKPNP